MSPTPPPRFLIGPGALDCNRGDQALLWQAIDALRQFDDKAEIAILSEGHANPEDPQSRQTRALGIRVLAPFMDNPRRVLSSTNPSFIDSRRAHLRMAIQAGIDFIYSLILWLVYPCPALTRPLLSRSRRQTYDYLRTCKALVIKGGGYLYAHSGPKWLYFLWFGLLPLIFAQRLGIKTLVLPNSIGPFESKLAQTLAKWVLNRCHLLTVRESHSAQTLAPLLSQPVKSFPDMAFGLTSADSQWAQQILHDHQVPYNKQHCVGITLRPWRFPASSDPQAQYQQYIQAIAEFVEHLLRQDYYPILFVHVQGPHAHEDDRIALCDLQVQLKQPIPMIDGNFNCQQLKALYGYMHAMVCTRLHSAIFSMAQGIPCIAINYQGYKSIGLVQDMGVGDFVMSIQEITAASLIQTFEQLEQERTHIQEQLAVNQHICQAKLESLQHQIEEALT